jgi:hypothetical protein
MAIFPNWKVAQFLWFIPFLYVKFQLWYHSAVGRVQIPLQSSVWGGFGLTTSIIPPSLISFGNF